MRLFQQIKASTAQGLSNYGKDEDEKRHRTCGDEERGPKKAFDAYNNGNNKGEGSQVESAEDPHEDQENEEREKNKKEMEVMHQRRRRSKAK